MKAEPFNGMDIPYTDKSMECVRLMANKKIKSAVEWLKKECRNYPNYKGINEIIDQAFEDVTK